MHQVYFILQLAEKIRLCVFTLYFAFKVYFISSKDFMGLGSVNCHDPE